MDPLTQTPPILRLPKDIFLCILDYTTEVSKMSLFFTCHALWEWRDPKNKHFFKVVEQDEPNHRDYYDEEEEGGEYDKGEFYSLYKMEYLSLLEKDMPDYVVYDFGCAGWPRMVRWTADGGKTYDEQGIRKRLRRIGGVGFHADAWWCMDYWNRPVGNAQKESIPYSLLRVVMNRHFLGEGYGLDLSVLNFDSEEKTISGDEELFIEKMRMKVTVSRRARIIRDRLYIATITRVWDVDGSEAQAALAYVRYTKNFRLCYHLRSGLGIYVDEESLLTNVYGCLDCKTDWRVEMVENRERGRMEVRLGIWHDLGSVRSAKELSKGTISRHEDDNGDMQTGDVYNAWVSAEGEGDQGPGGDSNEEGYAALWALHAL